jgi:hypothetical protein
MADGGDWVGAGFSICALVVVINFVRRRLGFTMAGRSLRVFRLGRGEVSVEASWGVTSALV